MGKRRISKGGSLLHHAPIIHLSDCFCYWVPSLGSRCYHAPQNWGSENQKCRHLNGSGIWLWRQELVSIVHPMPRWSAKIPVRTWNREPYRTPSKILWDLYGVGTLGHHSKPVEGPSWCRSTWAQDALQRKYHGSPGLVRPKYWPLRGWAFRSKGACGPGQTWPREGGFRERQASPHPPSPPQTWLRNGSGTMPRRLTQPRPW